MKENFLRKEWKQMKDIQKNYYNYDDFKNFMNESAEQYLELKEKVVNFDGVLKDFINTLEFGYTNYEENKYVDFNYGNLTCTVIQKNNNLYLSKYVEIWNDGICTCEYNSFDIEECLN